MDFVLLNNASSATDSNGGPLLAPVLIRIAGALEVYLDRDVALVWGGSYRVRAGSSSADIQPGEVACAIVDSLPDAPGAVAYHDVSGAEVPVVFLAKSQCDSLISGPDSVSSALSHELVEASVDPFCNEWIQDASGRQWAKEAADPLQEWTYEIDGVTVSDFVLPSFWAPGSAGPWNFGALHGGQAISGPFAVATGGYAIVQTGGTGETQITGEIRQHRMARKLHPASRTHRRGWRGKVAPA